VQVSGILAGRACAVHRHMRPVSPWRQRVGASAARTAGGASGLLPQRTSSVTPRSSTYSARLWCRALGLRVRVHLKLSGCVYCPVSARPGNNVFAGTQRWPVGVS